MLLYNLHCFITVSTVQLHCFITVSTVQFALFHNCICCAAHPQDMVSSVSSLLKIVRNVEDEAGRGVKTLENAIEAIKEELRVSCTLAA